jgi:hypothetical protein
VDANENQPDGVKVCRMKLDDYPVMFEQEEIEESCTLQMLVNSNTSLDTDYGDVWRDEDAQVPTSSLDPDRFSQVTS